MASWERKSAEPVRRLIAAKQLGPELFRAALLSMPPSERDAWVDELFELGGIPEDDPALPQGCVPYLPCPVELLLRVVEKAPVRASDVFVDVGFGPGRAGALVHLLTGATVLGLEIQPRLVDAARELIERLGLERVSCLQGDAAEAMDAFATGSVFFFYCPFSGERLVTSLAGVERVARTRVIRVCTVDLPLPACDWLELQEHVPPGNLAIFKSRALPWQLRPAAVADTADIARLWHQGWHDAHVGHVPEWLLPHRTLESFRSRVPARVKDTVVAAQNDALLGFVTVQEDEVEQIFVAATARGTGVAGALLQHAEDVIAARYGSAWLAVVTGNSRARGFYARQGWKDAGPIDDAVEIGGRTLTVPARRYEKRLATTLRGR